MRRSDPPQMVISKLPVNIPVPATVITAPSLSEVVKLKITRKRGVVVPLRYAAVTAANGSRELVVEAPGVEPGSENVAERASTCVVDGLI